MLLKPCHCVFCAIPIHFLIVARIPIISMHIFRALRVLSSAPSIVSSAAIGNKKRSFLFPGMLWWDVGLRLTVSAFFQQRTTHALYRERKQLMITERRKKLNSLPPQVQQLFFLSVLRTVYLNREINKFFIWEFRPPHWIMCLANVSREFFMYVYALIAKSLSLFEFDV